MAQQNIDFGTFPDDPSADAIRTAFQKVQQNFTEVYVGLTNASVTSVNRTAGVGITVNAPTGNVVVSANIASITVSSVTLKVGTSPNPVTNTATYSSYSQTLYVEIPDNLSIGNVTASGNITATGNLTVTNANLGNLATANFFSGNGNALFNIQGANITGAVSSASTSGTVTSNAQPNITSLGTLTSVTVTGNINAGNATLGNAVTANYFIGSGANLTNIPGSNISGTISNANYATYAGDIINSTQSNITAVGTLATLSVLGNANVGNIGATNGVFTNVSGNGSALSSITGANVSGAVSFATTANSIAGANVSGAVANATHASTANTIVDAAQPNITSTGTLTSVSVSGNANIGNVGTSIITATGNITGGNLSTGGTLSVSGTTTLGNLSVTGTLNAGDITVGSISNGTSNVDIVGVSGNVVTSVAGVANVLVVTTSGANIAGTLSASGNINAGNVTATTFTGALSGTATSATTAGTVTTNAQPNITSLGTLTSLSVSGNSNLGNVGNVKITGGANGTYLVTDGAGNLTFGSIVNTPPGGANNDVQFKDGGTYQGSSNFTFNPTSNTVSITGTLSVSGNVSVSGNANVGNIGATNIVGTLTTATQPNITSVGTLAGLTLNANLNSNSNIVLNNVNANISTLGNISANYFIGNIQGANVTGTVANATYAVTAGTANSVALANVSGAGNIASINISGNSSQILYGNGVFAAASVTYGNSNVATFLASYGSNTITTTGSVSVGNIIGNGQALTGLAGANVTGQVGNALVAGTVYTNAQPNITSVGALTDLSVSGNGVIGGNLTVNGTLTYINSTTLSISDPIINLQTGANGAAPVSNSGKDVGTALNYYDTTAKIAWMGWDVSNAEIAFGSNVGISSEVVTFTSLANIRSGNAQLGNDVTANYFIGSGNNLSNILGANVTGTVANATFATTAGSANSVAGANVTGTVANATFATTAGTVTTAAQPNITSVGTLTSLSSSGNITGANIIATNYNIRSVGTGISAAGSSQGTGTALTKEINIVSTVSSGANGVVLPTAVAGMVISVTNTTANAMIIYPAFGGQINSLGTNAGFSMGTTTIQFIAPTTTQWYTTGATYA